MKELIARAQSGEQAAAEQLIAENTGLIWSVARRYFGRGAEPDDLYQLGCIGFLKAVQGFDSAFGTQFSTYAVPKIAGEIRRFLRDDGPVKVSRTLKERAGMLHALRQQIMSEFGREPSVSELSELTGFTAEEIAAAETATVSAQSLQQEYGEDGFTLEEVLCDGDAERRLYEHLSLREAIEKLPERERLVISLRFYHDMTQEQTARVISVSQVQVSRLEKKALSRLKTFL